ncbi:hypothetical protein [Candidatus Minimicrobia naudis]
MKEGLAGDFSKSLMTLFGSIAILSGIYMVLYLFSKYRYGEDKTWISFGDVKLGLGLGLFLGNWLLAFTALFNSKSYRHASCLAINDAKKITNNFTDMLRSIAYRKGFYSLGSLADKF